MTTIGVVAHEGKTVGGGLGELREVLTAEGFADPPWRQVPKSRKAPAAVAELVEAGIDTLLVWGGDGTVQRSIDALVDLGAGSRVDLAVIPAGTANLFANNLAIPTGDVRAAVDVALCGARRTIDVGRANGEHFAVMAGTGFDALMIRDADRSLKDVIGRAAYVWTGARNLAAASANVTVEVDGTRFYKGHTGCLLVGNVGRLMGGVPAFPDAEPDSGQLEVAVVTAESRRDWVRVMARMAVGRGPSSPLVEHTRGRRIDVRLDRKLPYELDGGARKATRTFKVRVCPGAITVRVPAAS